MTDDLRARLAMEIRTEFWKGGREDLPVWIVPGVLDGIMPLVRAEIAAAEHRGAERAAQAIERYREERPRRSTFAKVQDAMGGMDDMRGWATCFARIAREAVPAPTGDNA